MSWERHGHTIGNQALKDVKNNVSKKNRYRVMILCRRCGERYFLRGRMKNGRIDTGFKRCLCDNETEFEIKSEKVVP